MALNATQAKRKRKTSNPTSPSPDVQNGHRAVIHCYIPFQRPQIPLCSAQLGGHPGKTTRLHFSLCAGAERQGERKLLRLLSYNIGVNGPINWLAVAGGGRAKWGVRVGWLCGLGGEEGVRRGPRQRGEIKYDSGKCNNVPLGYTGGQFLGLLERNCKRGRRK